MAKSRKDVFELLPNFSSIYFMDRKRSKKSWSRFYFLFLNYSHNPYIIELAESRGLPRQL